MCGRYARQDEQHGDSRDPSQTWAPPPLAQALQKPLLPLLSLSAPPARAQHPPLHMPIVKGSHVPTAAEKSRHRKHGERSPVPTPQSSLRNVCDKGRQPPQGQGQAREEHRRSTEVDGGGEAGTESISISNSPPSSAHTRMMVGSRALAFKKHRPNLPSSPNPRRILRGGCNTSPPDKGSLRLSQPPSDRCGPRALSHPPAGPPHRPRASQPRLKASEKQGTLTPPAWSSQCQDLLAFKEDAAHGAPGWHGG